MVSESGEACILALAEHCLIGCRQPDSADVLNVPNILQSCFVLLKNSYEKLRYVVFFTFFFFKQVDANTAESVIAEEQKCQIPRSMFLFVLL